MKTRFLISLMLLLSLTLSAQLEKLALKNGVGSANAGSASNPYLLSTKKDLGYLQAAVAKGSATVPQPTIGMYFEMTNDIDLSSQDFSGIGINNTTGAFSGTFDGKGYAIIGLKAGTASARASRANTGFFGYTLAATIKNLTLSNVSFYITNTGNSLLGALIGEAIGSNILNCSVSGLIDVNSMKTNSLGGIAGSISSQTNIINCNADMTLVNLVPQVLMLMLAVL